MIDEAGYRRMSMLGRFLVRTEQLTVEGHEKFNQYLAEELDDPGVDA